MKKNLLVLFFASIPSILLCQITGGSIHAVVNGDKVVLHEDNSTRNYGFNLSINNVIVNDNIIQWFQVDTIHNYARCDCNFNYSLEIDSLVSGDYTAYLYAVDQYDTTYLGYTKFSIFTSFSHVNGLKLASYASPCMSYPEEQLNVNVSSYTIEFYALYERIRKVRLWSMTGKPIYSELFNNNYCEIPVSILNPGTYIAEVQTENRQFNKKIIILR